MPLTTAAILRLLRQKAPVVAHHSIRVADLCLRVDPALPAAVLLAALAHDAGKVWVPQRLLTKPGQLTRAEWLVMRQHPAQGLAQVSALRHDLGLDGIPQLARDVILHHHERWDGAGYPDGLAGPATGYYARLIGVVDAYDAMTEERPYHTPKTHHAALRELERSAGTQFDPLVVARVVSALAHPSPSWDAPAVDDQGDARAAICYAAR